MQSISEQVKAAHEAITNEKLTSGFVCLACKKATKDSPWTWFIEKIFSHQLEADNWWKNKQGLARVYGVSDTKVWIRNAK